MGSRDVQFCNWNNTEFSWGLSLSINISKYNTKIQIVFEWTKERKIEETIFKFSLSISFSLLCFTAHISSLISLDFLHCCQVTFFQKEKYLSGIFANCFKCTQLLGNSALTILSLLCHDKEFPPLISNTEILLT